MDDGMKRTNKLCFFFLSSGGNIENIIYFGKRNYHMQVAEHQAVWSEVSSELLGAKGPGIV